MQVILYHVFKSIVLYSSLPGWHAVLLMLFNHWLTSQSGLQLTEINRDIRPIFYAEFPSRCNPAYLPRQEPELVIAAKAQD